MSDDPAARRFFIIQIVRVSGVAATVYALLALQGIAPWPAAFPRAAAYMLLLIGLTDALIVPQLLSRKWRSGR